LHRDELLEQILEDERASALRSGLRSPPSISSRGQPEGQAAKHRASVVAPGKSWDPELVRQPENLSAASRQRVRREYCVSERRTCGTLGQHRSTQRKTPQRCLSADGNANVLNDSRP
jgi:hypothetical protein